MRERRGGYGLHDCLVQADGRSFEALLTAVLEGRVKVLPHFRQRAVERGFTVEHAFEVLSRDDAAAEPWQHNGWLVTAALPADPDPHQIHVRVKITSRRVLLVTGWRAKPRGGEATTVSAP